MTRFVAFVQARMTSTRLPGKVLMDLQGAPMLAQQLRRLQGACALDEIVVATTTNPTDEPVAELARAEGLAVFRGSESDVLGRYLGAAKAHQADVVVRITADCPLIDPGVVDTVCAALEPGLDYASNVVRRTYPQGLDAEALHLDVLQRLDRLATSPGAREHVTWFLLKEKPELFHVRSVEDTEDNSDLRWTVDVDADLDVVRALYRDLGLDRHPLGYRKILEYTRARGDRARSSA